MDRRQSRATSFVCRARNNPPIAGSTQANSSLRLSVLQQGDQITGALIRHFEGKPPGKATWLIGVLVACSHFGRMRPAKQAPTAAVARADCRLSRPELPFQVFALTVSSAATSRRSSSIHFLDHATGNVTVDQIAMYGACQL